MAWDLQYSIRHTAVGRLFKQAIDQWLQDYRSPFGGDLTVTLRCDNDGRFVAHELQTFLSDNFINQEFILPATPQQNAHIESFHSVFEELVCQKYEFEHIHHCREVLERFFPTYNHRRSLSSLKYLPPAVFLNEWQNGNLGLNMKKIRGKVIQTFFFRGQRPKWRSALSEDFLLGGICKDIHLNPIIINPTLNES